MGVDEADPMRRILQERAARWLRLEDTGLAFDAEIFLNAATLGHPFDEGGRALGIELIGHQYPTRIGFDSGGNVGGEIRVGSVLGLTILSVTTSKFAIKHKVPCPRRLRCFSEK